MITQKIKLFKCLAFEIEVMENKINDWLSKLDTSATIKDRHTATAQSVSGIMVVVSIHYTIDEV